MVFCLAVEPLIRAAEAGAPAYPLLPPDVAWQIGKDSRMTIMRPAMSAFLLAALLTTAPAAPSFAQECACPAPGPAFGGNAAYIEADQPPPPLPDYDQPPMPAPGYYWTPGYWAWNNTDYYWVPGAWVEPPQPGLLWTPGYWAFAAGVFVFHPGYWGPHVGFYGGIDYHYGYTGAGYVGGRWDNGQFYYNRAVNNLGPARTGNVYNEAVAVNNATINRVSFNGGEGGVTARPTPAQVLAAKEQHIPPTGPQKDHARIASMNGGQFVSTNNGKPPVAATPRPGQLKGKGVLPAKAAGTAQQTVVPPAGGNVAPQINDKRPPLTGEGQGTNPAAAPPIKTEPLTPGAAKAPIKAEPLNPAAPKAQEKLPTVEKPIKTEPLTPGPAKVEEKLPAAEKAIAPMKPSATGTTVAPAAPKVEEKLHNVERPATPARPPVVEKTVAPPPPGPAAPTVAAKPLAPKPEHKPAPKECARPGQPKCP